jgi:hypothetical protein
LQNLGCNLLRLDSVIVLRPEFIAQSFQKAAELSDQAAGEWVQQIERLASRKRQLLFALAKELRFPVDAPLAARPLP